MSELFFLEQMVRILNAPVWIYDDTLQLIRRVGTEEKMWWGKMGIEEKEAENILLSPVSYPAVYAGKGDNVAAVIHDGCKQKIYVCGPVTVGISGSAEERKNSRPGKNHKGKTQGYCPLDKFISGCILLYREITGKEITVSQLWDYNKGNFKTVALIQKRLSEDVFLRQEYYGKHNPSEQELRELESIEKGDEEALRQSISETYEGSIGILAKTPLRHYKNVAIGNITLASRAAIRGGLSTENSFSMADSMIQQVEEINNIPEVEMFKRECQFMYVAAVHDQKKRRGWENEAEENPVVGKVKDYIFSHLHSKIKVADIAETLKLNPDYLSHIFSKSEHITIKKYILEEKIRRSQNLLKYSDYTIQEISFYLGFSSQSHFTRVFCEITGVKPNDYRKKYGNREKWK